MEMLHQNHQTRVTKRSARASKIRRPSDTGHSTPKVTEINGGAHAAFQLFFESQFEPLPVLDEPTERDPSAAEDEAGEDSVWHGISESDDNEPAVEIINHAVYTGSRPEPLPIEELKAFLTSKPPSMSTTPIARAKRKASDRDEESLEKDDTANLAKDLALQRLLKESHLLDASTSSSLDPSGGNRHKAIDLRLQALGSKTSILTQIKMPMSHRKGMIAKATERDEKRRRQAKDNGIILEKVKKGSKLVESRRERGIGAPSIGKFTGGMLKLSKRDVASIEGPKTSAGNGGKGRRK